MPLAPSSRGLLDLPTEVLANIMAMSEPADLAALARSCGILYQYAIPVLWRNISLDLTASSTRATHHLYDGVVSTHICDAIVSSKVSVLAYASIRSLAINLSPVISNNRICDYIINPHLLRNLSELTLHGATDWGRVAPTVTRLAQFPAGKCVLHLHDIPLACLIELALPVSPLNAMVRTVATTFSSVANTATDVDLLANTLAVLPNLESFALAFDSEFDLCDDARLEARFSALCRGFALYNRALTRVAVYDFPPYLHFDPTCLPCSVSEFVFHTNEIDDASLFYTQLLEMPARLCSLSLRIVQSVSSPTTALATAATAAKKSYGPVGLADLRALTLDVPSDAASAGLLETLLRRNRAHLARVALSGFTTTALCALLAHARSRLRELYVYAFAPGAAAACGALVLRAAHSGQFGRLRLLALPPLGAADLARCVALRRTATSKPKFALVTTTTTSDINDRHKAINIVDETSNKTTKFALGCAEARPPLAQLMATPPMSPVPFHCDDDHDDDETNDDENEDENEDDAFATQQQRGAPFLDQMALWKTIPFKSEDELDLFMFHSSTAAKGLGQLCVL